ncbi:MAG: NAD(P)-binding domain-containing protein, partial [Pseudomonadota bacterium]
MRYGYIGLGHLGGQLAGSLLRDGFPLTVTDLNKDLAAPLLARGAHWADSPKAVASASDAVITCLPSPAVSEKVLCGNDGILAGLRSGGAWIEMSTLGRDDILRLAAQAADRVVAQIAGGRLIGRSEADVAEEVRERLVAEGHDEASFAIVASGPNAASPHHEASDRTIQPGDPIVLDIGGMLGGYASDTTRTL